MSVHDLRIRSFPIGSGRIRLLDSTTWVETTHETQHKRNITGNTYKLHTSMTSFYCLSKQKQNQQLFYISDKNIVKTYQIQSSAFNSLQWCKLASPVAEVETGHGSLSQHPQHPHPQDSLHIHSVHLPVKSDALLSSLTNNTDVYAELHPLSEQATFHYLLRHSFIPVSLIQTLTTLNLWKNQIGDQGAQYLGEALRHNTVRSLLLHAFTIISFLSLSYRHSLHSTYGRIK